VARQNCFVATARRNNCRKIEGRQANAIEVEGLLKVLRFVGHWTSHRIVQWPRLTATSTTGAGVTIGDPL
jgi:hypothetical protein